ncbi:hypothetical protein J4E85_002932 [Alternaria conjuncta]|uniref:uncharacterized protein n=1 Tax=Alternaria conjuncta TaxID=181017 RepID=UPI00221F6409|nr:uncharacterized protein J4E85_002932 [Alternaria conjuncta]KAI4932534.1 hypothetical protein J4E85_002932 [Alternaria conjuncta]
MPPLIALRYLDSDVLTASIERKLSREELKYVTRRLLLALNTLHEKGYVHSGRQDIKTNNIFFNSQEGPNRFADVQLGDLGDCCTVDSERARSGKLVGAPVWSSPEVILEMPWNTATDIWSFGTVVISLIYGGDRNLFQPQDVKRGEQGYLLGVLERQFRYFGPFLPPFIEMGDGGIAQIIQYLMETIPYGELTPFASVTEGQVAKKDRNFISKIMQLDWRDRPTAKELLEDEWWQDD